MQIQSQLNVSYVQHFRYNQTKNCQIQSMHMLLQVLELELAKFPKYIFLNKEKSLHKIEALHILLHLHPLKKFRIFL